VREVTFLLILCLLCVAPVMAQSPTATINGIVVDPSGAAIAGAQVVIVNDATGVQYSTKTNGEGVYVVPNLPPGPYRIQVSNTGFKTIIKPDIVIHVQDALAINFTLPIGAASEIMTVQGGAPLIDAENAAVSTVIDRKFVESLPLNGRSFNTLLQLTPGVVIAPVAPGQSGQFSIAGQRTDANSFTVDGVSANFGVLAAQPAGESGTGGAQAFSALGGTSSLVSVDALQEFRIETSSFAPEFGRTPGGQVILTTRSGTNDFHGEAFDYFRNTVMDANDWFANAAGNPRAPEHHNDFGGVLGGPLRKDKTFFFFSYEGARLDQPQTTPILVPSEYSRTQAATNTPALAAYLNAYPQPDDKTMIPGVYTSPFTGTYGNPSSLDATSIRIDHTFNDRFSIFGRYNYAPSQTLQRLNSLSDLGATIVNTQTLTLGLNVSGSARTSNTVRGNYSTQSSGLSYSLDSFGGAVPLSPSLLLGSLSPSNNEGLFQPFDVNPLIVGFTFENQAKQANFVDDLTVTLGSHLLKFGGDYRAIFLTTDNSRQMASYFATSVQQFVSSGSTTLDTRTQLPAHFLVQSLSLFAQDTWKATPRLTFTYGLRWELSPAPSARGNTTLAAFENVFTLAAIALAPAGAPLWSTTYRNFAPRIGVAYSLTAKGDILLRAGGGIFYDLGVGSSANLGLFFPNSASGSFPGVSVPVTDLTPYLPTISTQPPYPTGTQGISPNLKLPRSYQWNVALEKSFGGRHAFSATYVGQAGRDLLRQESLFQPNANFSGIFDLTLNDARSNYHALQLQYRRPLSAGLQVLLNYTFAHSLDNAANDVVAGLSNTVISAASDYASSNWDVRSSFSGALSYDIPAAAKSGPLAPLSKNWSLQAVIVARSGFPFNALSFDFPPLSGIFFTRPDVVPGQPFWVSNTAAAGGKSLNPNAFVKPSTTRQGTEARNDIPGFGLTQVDLSIARKFPITDRLGLQFRADAFNLFNHPNFANPLGIVGFGPFYLQSHFMLNQGLGGLNPLFQQGGPRSLQLSLKITF
jgi:hypothetical protein